MKLLFENWRRFLNEQKEQVQQKPLLVLIGDSQTAGPMGAGLEKHYTNLGYNVKRFGHSGKGARFFNNALAGRFTAVVRTKNKTTGKWERNAKRTARIRNRQKQLYTLLKNHKPAHIVVSSLGGNDAVGRGSSINRKRTEKLYTTFYSKLKSFDVPVTLNGSPAAPTRKNFDLRRAKVDAIQSEIATKLGMTHNSVRGANLGRAAKDGVHYRKPEYAKHLTSLENMPKLPKTPSLKPAPGGPASPPPPTPEPVVTPDIEAFNVGEIEAASLGGGDIEAGHTPLNIKRDIDETPI